MRYYGSPDATSKASWKIIMQMTNGQTETKLFRIGNFGFMLPYKSKDLVRAQIIITGESPHPVTVTWMQDLPTQDIIFV